MKYWGFRTDVDCPASYYEAELEGGYLRQGWGYEDWQDLRKADTTKVRELRANRRMYESVKKGDIVLIPHLPDWQSVRIAKAKDDWNTGYDFKIGEQGDYGHMFPAERLRYFNRSNQNVHGDLARTLRCRSRFWDMTQYAAHIDALLDCDQDALITSIQKDELFRNIALGVMASLKDQVEDAVHRNISEKFEGTSWEFGLVEGLRALFPAYYIERTGGNTEKSHGTDILITMPGLAEQKYGIAIQVKDKQWQVSDASIDKAVQQIKKADDYWPQERGDLRIIEKIVVFTDVDVSRREQDVIFVDRKGLKSLLRRMAIALATRADNESTASY